MKTVVTPVTNKRTGETGWRAIYGVPESNMLRMSVFTTKEAAEQADLSDDVGPTVIARHINLTPGAWQEWEETKDA